MFCNGRGPRCTARSSGPRRGSATATPSCAGDERWSFAELDGLSNAFARHLAELGVGPRRPRRGDAHQPASSSCVAVNAISKLGAAAGAARARRGRRSRSATRSTLTGARPRRRRRPGRRRCSREPLGAERVIDLDDAAALAAALDRDRAPLPDAGARRRRRGDPRVQLGHHRAAEGGAPHPRVDRRRHPALGRRPRPRPRRPLPGGHAAVAHPRACSTCSPPPRPGATVRLHRRFDLDEVLRRIEAERMTLEMAVAPIAPGDGQPPDARGPRPLVAPLHHVGRHAGDRERGRDRDRAHRRALPARLRRQRAPGDRLQPGRPTRPRGASTRPACPRPRWSCASSTSTPARCSSRAAIGEIQAREPVA